MLSEEEKKQFLKDRLDPEKSIRAALGDIVVPAETVRKLVDACEDYHRRLFGIRRGLLMAVEAMAKLDITNTSDQLRMVTLQGSIQSVIKHNVMSDKDSTILTALKRVHETATEIYPPIEKTEQQLSYALGLVAGMSGAALSKIGESHEVKG